MTDEPAAVRETHSAWVFLAGDHTVKAVRASPIGSRRRQKLVTNPDKDILLLPDVRGMFRPMAGVGSVGGTCVEGSAVRLHLLRSFDLRHEGAPVVLPASAQQVLAFLAVRGEPVRRSLLAGQLWLDHPEARAAANLRGALWKLRLPGVRLVETIGDVVAVSPSVTVDYEEAVAQAKRVLAGGDDLHECDLRYEPLAGDLLPDWYDDWVVMEQERFRQLRLHALEALSDRLLRLGRPSEAIQAALVAVAGEPLRESAQRALIAAHLAEGNRAEAMRQYARYRDLLDESLGLRPSPLLDELVADLGRAGPPSGGRVSRGVAAGPAGGPSLPIPSRPGGKPAVSPR